MIINADLHIHSRFSGATSQKMNLKSISYEAPRKGLDIMATGDCLNSNWLDEISKCDSIDEGTFEMDGTRFILSTEVEDENKVHHLLYFNSISSVNEFKIKVHNKSKNLETDGRPNISLNGEEIAQFAKDVEALIGPSHAFTPWTSLYAHHLSLDSCYGNLSDYVSFVELGLSADTDEADKIQELHRLTFLTNSDCHSPHPVRLGREFTRFEVKEATFSEIKKAILRTNGNKPVLNIGLPPQEGKYHESACISCYTHYTIDDAIRRKWKCHCGKKIKKGVKDRINEIASFYYLKHPDHRPPYLHLIPLAEIITKAVGQRSPFTKTVTRRWEELVNYFGNEITVLIDAEFDEIRRITTPAIADSIEAFRQGKVRIIPGGGGKYGEILLPDEEEPLTVSLGPSNHQSNLLEFR